MPNLYTIDKSFVQKKTSADTRMREGIPENVLKTAGVPSAPVENSLFAQLLNPEGQTVDYFISHAWGNEFGDV